MSRIDDANSHQRDIIKCIRIGYASNPARFNSKCRLCFVFDSIISLESTIIISEICKLLKFNKEFTNVLITDDDSLNNSIDQIEHFIDDAPVVINDHIKPLKYISVDTQRQTPMTNRKFRNFFGSSNVQKKYMSTKVNVISDNKILKIYKNINKLINKK